MNFHSKSIRKTKTRGLQNPVSRALVTLKRAEAQGLKGARKNPVARLVDAIGPGDRVSIVDRFGKIRTGRAVMHGPAGWMLNLGGAHGTPGIATDANVVKVVASKRDAFRAQAGVIDAFKNPAKRKGSTDWQWNYFVQEKTGAAWNTLGHFKNKDPAITFAKALHRLNSRGAYRVFSK